MELEEWITKKKMQKQEFARLAGIAHFYLWQILTKRRYASLDLAHTIEKLTKGQVKAKDLMRPARERVQCPTCGKICNAENLVEKKGTKGEHP